MATERTGSERLKAGLFATMANAIKAFGIRWVASGKGGAASKPAENGASGNGHQQGAGINPDLARRNADADADVMAPDAGAIAQVAVQLLGELQNAAIILATHAGLAGEASGQLAVMSRSCVSTAAGPPPQRDGSLRAGDQDCGTTAPDQRSESAFVSGAAHSLQASIDHASAVITDLAAAIAVVAASPAPAATVTELAQHATATIARLGEANRQISEIAAFIEKVVLPAHLLALDVAVAAARGAGTDRTFLRAAEDVGALAMQARQAGSDIHAIARSVVGGAMEAGYLLDEISAVIAQRRDAMLTRLAA